MWSVYVYVTAAVVGKFQLSYGKFGPTEIRVLAILINVLMFSGVNLYFSVGPFNLTLYDGLIALIALALYGIFIGKSIQTAKELDKMDRKEKST